MQTQVILMRKTKLGRPGKTVRAHPGGCDTGDKAWRCKEAAIEHEMQKFSGTPGSHGSVLSRGGRGSDLAESTGARESTGVLQCQGKLVGGGKVSGVECIRGRAL